MSFLMNASIAGAIANLVFLTLLLYVYGTTYQKMRTGFTLGLIIFAMLFLIQNVITLYSYLTMMSLYASGVELHVTLFTWAQTVGLGALLLTTWK
ncbi:MAG: hypothetical protein ACE5HJ_09895 [Thermoplasmata archaeon]